MFRYKDNIRYGRLVFWWNWLPFLAI